MKVIILVGGAPRAEYLRSQPPEDLRQLKTEALKFALERNYLTIAESLVATFQLLGDDGKPFAEIMPKGTYY